ncbi:MAG: hypothetical protein LBQ77_03925 [Treponema sp.]|jgi:hypothetical protein|nr:hypothetical protein [Treponema sp.]
MKKFIMAVGLFVSLAAYSHAQTIILNPQAANLTRAPGARLESNPQNIGYWTKAGVVSWTIPTGSLPGVYTLSLNYARQATDSVKILTATNSNAIEADLPATGSWTNYQSRTLGTLIIEQGDSTVTISLSNNDRSSGNTGSYIMNLRSVTLQFQNAIAQPVPLPQPVQPTGTITLAPAQANLSRGSGARLENNPQNIGYWTKAGVVSWTIPTGFTPGVYTLSLNYARQATDSVKILTATNSNAIEADLPATGSWTNYQSRTLGTLIIEQGDSTVTIALSNNDRSTGSTSIMNLRSVTLQFQNAIAQPVPLPQPVQPTGTITLAPAQANLSQGSGARLENNPQNIGYWTKAGIVSWTLPSGFTPGVYTLSLNYARQATDSVKILTATNSNAIEADLPATGSWTNYQSRTLGTLIIEQGDSTVTIALSNNDRSTGSTSIMNLRSVTLQFQNAIAQPVPLPQPVQPTPQPQISAFSLAPAQANLSRASGALVENNPQNIGNWTRQGIVTWTVPSNVIAGNYAITANYSRAAAASEAVRIRISTNGGSFDVDLPGTTNWNTYTTRTVGALWINPNDVITVALSPNDRSNSQYLMNLRGLSFSLATTAQPSQPQLQPQPVQAQPSRPTIPSPAQPSRPAIPPPPPPRR